jgi:phage tail-like protein
MYRPGKGRISIVDYLHKFRFFLIDIGYDRSPAVPFLLPLFGFSNISGLKFSGETKEISPLNSRYTIKVPTKISMDTITLERGISLFDSNFFSWLVAYQNGEAEARNLLLVHLTGTNIALGLARIPELQLSYGSLSLGGLRIDRLPGRFYILKNCVPVSYEVDDFDASANEIALQRLELACEIATEYSLLG